MSSAAARMRDYRARRGAGLIILQITVDEVAVPAALVEAGFLDPAKVDDRLAVASAIEVVIATMARSDG